MKTKMQILGLFTFILVALIALSSCGEIVSSRNEVPDTYSAQYAQSPTEYMIFIDKEITPITNCLTTEILLSRHVEEGSITKEKALESAKSTLNTITECIEQVDMMQPPASYTEVRQNVLSAMDQCKVDIEEYIDVLEGEKTTSFSSLRDSMQADFILITGEFELGNE